MYIRDFWLQNIQQWTGNYFWIVYDLSKWLHVQQDCSHESSSLPRSCYATSFFYFCYFQDTCNASDLGFLSHDNCILLLHYVQMNEGLQIGASNSVSMWFVPLRKKFSTSVISCRFLSESYSHYKERKRVLYLSYHIWLHIAILPGEHIYLKWLKFIYIYKHICMYTICIHT